MTLFQAKGEKPQWELVYAKLLIMKVGDLVTYPELSEAIGFDIRTNRTPYSKAVRVLEQEHKRTLDNVRGIGYRVVEAREHVGLAKRQHRSAKRRLQRGHELAVAADRSALTPEERERVDRIELTLSRQQTAIARLESRADALDGAVKAVRRETKAGVAEVSDRVAKLEEQLAKLSPADEEAKPS